MGKILMPGGGGGADLDVITAGAEDVLAGKVIVDKNGEPLTGTMADQGNWNFSELVAGSAVTVPGGKHGGGGKVTAKSLASQTPGDSAAGHILAGRTAWVNGSKITGTIPSQAGGTLTPSTSAVTANCSGKYMTSNYTIPAFALPPANALCKGYSYTLYGKTVTGTFEGYVASPLYFFNNGTWSNLQTTGMTNTTATGTYLSLNSGSIGRLNQTVDLTNYKYLKVKAQTKNPSSAGYKFYIGISKSASETDNSISVYNVFNSTSSALGVNIFDITSYQGGYYIYIFGFINLYSGSAATSIGSIYEIFLSNS